jgi:hypothetical protein
MNIQDVAELEPQPIEIDPRACDWCGLTIDEHLMVDDGDGPEFFCQEIHPHAADLVRQWEMQDPRDAWRHTGEIPPPVAFRNADFPGTPAPIRQHYRTPQATIDAFFYVAGLNDAEYLKRWLKQHPRDAETLCKLWEGKNAAKA